jgi:hypothetical protein
MNINDEPIKSNDEIIYAIRKHMMNLGIDQSRIKQIIRGMSDDDLTCYYEEKCK